MTPEHLRFLVHQIYPLLSPLDQLNLVRANIVSTMNMQYHLSVFFYKVAGVVWSTVREMLASVSGVIGGTIVALFFSPVWYRHRARFEVYVDKRKVQNKDVLAAFYKGILDLNSVMWSYQYAKCVQAGISTKYLETHPITLLVGYPKPSCTADSNFITYDRVLCLYYNFARKRQVYSFTNNNSRLSQYVCNGYRQLSLMARMFNMIYHRNEIPTDVVVVFFAYRARTVET